ncbi:helix-turn-helix domain-containing protein [Variovorax boronicumulans]
MKLTPDSLPELALRLKAERRRQGLSRAQAAAVCGVSTSFIRDAESDPGRCSLLKLLLLGSGLGLQASFDGWLGDDPGGDAGSPDGNAE